MKKSLLSPKSFPKINNIEGVLFSTGNCGLKKNKEKDLVIIQLNKKAVTAGVFTNSKTISEAVKWSKKNIRNDIKAIIVNSGNANALTGKNGYNSIEKYAKCLANQINCTPKNILIASTGVIGKQIDYKKINKNIPKLFLKSKKKCCSWKSFSESIMTTDTFPKAATKKIRIGGEIFTISGVAKGSGMIYPNMGTMLAFIFTNASISKDVLNKILFNGVQESFNSITVDGDTSTSDTVFFTATNKKKNKIDSVKSYKYAKFAKAFNELILDLATQIVKDGEGAKKFIKIKVKNAKNYFIAKNIAFSVANSLLVKTLLGSREPNFGRIFMAIGKSFELINQDKISFSLGKILIVRNGTLLEKINLKKVMNYMKNKDLFLEINLQQGKFSKTVYTCDLTEQYININTNYLT